MQLNNGEEADLGTIDWCRTHLDRLDFLLQPLEKGLSHRAYQSYVLEHDLEELSVLLVVRLSVIWVDLDLAPVRVGYSFEHDVKYLQNLFIDACR